MSHTKGEWKLLDTPCDAIASFEIFESAEKLIGCTYNDLSKEENKANAQLMVAAPVMLKALEEACGALFEASMIDKTNTCLKALEIVENAIKKAKGQ